MEDNTDIRSFLTDFPGFFLKKLETIWRIWNNKGVVELRDSRVVMEEMVGGPTMGERGDLFWLDLFLIFWFIIDFKFGVFREGRGEIWILGGIKFIFYFEEELEIISDEKIDRKYKFIRKEGILYLKSKKFFVFEKIVVSLGQNFIFFGKYSFFWCSPETF